MGGYSRIDSAVPNLSFNKNNQQTEVSMSAKLDENAASVMADDFRRFASARWVDTIFKQAHVSPDEVCALAGTPVSMDMPLPPVQLKAQCPFASRTRAVLDEAPDAELEEIIRSKGIEVEHTNGCFQVTAGSRHSIVGRPRLVDLALLAVLSIALHT